MARIIGSNWLDYNFCIRLKPCTTCLLVAAERKLAVYAHACSSSFSIFQEERMKRIYFLLADFGLKSLLINADNYNTNRKETETSALISHTSQYQL